MDKGLVLAGGVIIVGALAGQALGMLPSSMGGSGGTHPIPLGLAPSKKSAEEATPTVINLPNENVVFPEVKLPTINLSEPIYRRPINYMGGGGKKSIRETELMRTIRRTGRTPRVHVSSSRYTRHVRGKKTAPAPSGFGGKTTTLTHAPSSAGYTPTKVTKAPSTPRSYQSPYISAPSKKIKSEPKRSWWSEFISGFKAGLFGGR